MRSRQASFRQSVDLSVGINESHHESQKANEAALDPLVWMAEPAAAPSRNKLPELVIGTL